MKTMCPPDYLHNGFVATHALGHMMYSHYAHLASVRFEHSVCVCVCVCVWVGGWVGVCGCVGVWVCVYILYLHTCIFKLKFVNLENVFQSQIIN